MCFTVSILQKGKNSTAEEYYRHFPKVKMMRKALPEVPFHYLVSGFAHPQLAIVRQDGVYLHEWARYPYELRTRYGNRVSRNKFWGTRR